MTEPSPVDPPAGPAAPAEPATASPDAAAATTEPPKRTLEGSLAAIDQETRQFILDEVARARREAGDARTAGKTAADAAKAELAQTIGKALGLVEGDEPADPAKLTEQLAVHQAEIKSAKTELAIHQAATAIGADALQLLDSRSFMAKLATVDPSDPLAVAAAVGEAVSTNPGLVKGKALPAPSPGVNGSAAGAPDLEAQIQAAQKAGDIKLAIHLQNQKLTSATSPR